MRKTLTVTALALGLLMQAGRLSASAFRVTPVRVELSQKTASTLLTLTNESDTDLRFQISAFAWSQDPAGVMKLDTTQDITFFPALLTLKPGEERKVRVGTKRFATDVEKSYRLFFEELPPLAVSAAPQEGAQVRILTKMGVPIFLTPAQSKPEARVDSAKVRGGNLSFDVRNNGNVHFAVQSVRVTGVGGDGAKLFERQLDGWYVLPGTPRAYEVEIPRDVCARVKNIEIEAQTNLTGPLSAKPSARVDVTQSSCKSGT